MSNSNPLPWIAAIVLVAVGAGAGGYFARPLIDGPAPAAAPAVSTAAQAAQEGRKVLPPGTTTTQVEDWTLICTPGEDPARPICFAAQDIRTQPAQGQKQGQLLLALIAGYDANGQRAFLVRAPLGVQLDQGLIFQIGEEKPIAFAFSACSDVSCDAQLIIPDGNFDKLEAAGSFTLAYIMAEGTPVKGTVSMKGLGKAYESIIKPDVAPAPTQAEGATPEAAPEAGDETPTPSPKPATP